MTKTPRIKSYGYLFILGGALLLLFVYPRFFTPLKFKVIGLASLPIRIVSFPLLEIKKLIFYHRTYNDYLRTRDESNTLKARLAGMEEVIRENTRLEQLLQFKRTLLFSAVAASVIGRDPSNWNATLILDKGSNDGVEVGMPVVSSQGVVGRVTESGSRKSKVILLTDPSFSVAALVQRSREVGLVSGTLQGHCRMRYLSAEADVQIGDKIVTSKLSSAFPEGILIGEVVSVNHRRNEMTMDCFVQSAVALSQIEECLIILTQ